MLPQGEFYVGAAESLPFEDGRFAIVTCMGSLEHFSDKPQALREMIRVAQADAKFLILVPNAGFATRRLGLFRGTLQTAVREDVYPLSKWESIFREGGLEVVARWRDLHVLSRNWILQKNPLLWPLRAAQATALAIWPMSWQYQIYHLCRKLN
jgi:SAM-dependent methyltransferase